MFNLNQFMTKFNDKNMVNEIDGNAADLTTFIGTVCPAWLIKFTSELEHITIEEFIRIDQDHSICTEMHKTLTIMAIVHNHTRPAFLKSVLSYYLAQPDISWNFWSAIIAIEFIESYHGYTPNVPLRLWSESYAKWAKDYTAYNPYWSLPNWE